MCFVSGDLVMVFLTHFTLSRTLVGMLLLNQRLKNNGTNTVILRGLSGKMTVNSLLIGALSTLLVFAIVMSNVAFSEKVYTDRTILKECPYDVIGLFDLSEVKGICDVDFSKESVNLNHRIYTRGGSSMAYPDFTRRLMMYFVIPDEAVETMTVAYEGRRRFAILFRLGVDTRMQKSALRKQIGAFFLMPFAFPLLMTILVGVIFGKVYEIWNLSGLSGEKAMETAVMIAAAVTGIYVLYFIITYRIACDHVVCYGSEL